MVQSKISIALVLAATAITPVVSQPLLRRENTDVTGSAFSRRFVNEYAAPYRRENPPKPGGQHPHEGQHDGQGHHHHDGQHNGQGHHHGGQHPPTDPKPATDSVTTQDPTSGSTNQVTPPVVRREYKGGLWARENPPKPGGQHPHEGQHDGQGHHHHDGQHNGQGHHHGGQHPPTDPKPATDSVTTQDPTSGSTNQVTPPVVRREYTGGLWARENPPKPGGQHPHEGQHDGQGHHHHDGQHNGQGHHHGGQHPPTDPKPATDSVTTQDPTSGSTNQVTPPVVRREYKGGLWARENPPKPGGQHPHEGQHDGQGHHHHDGQHNGQGHHHGGQHPPTDPKPATDSVTTQDPTSGSTNQVTPPVVRREYTGGLWARENPPKPGGQHPHEGQHDGQGHHHHDGQHNGQGHHHGGQHPPTDPKPVTDSVATQDPSSTTNQVPPPVRREYVDDGLWARGYDDFDLYARDDLYLD